MGVFVLRIRLIFVRLTEGWEGRWSLYYSKLELRLRRELLIVSLLGELDQLLSAGVTRNWLTGRF